MYYYCSQSLLLNPRRKTNSTITKLIPIHMRLGKTIKSFLDKILSHLLEVIIGHVLMGHDSNLIWRYVAHHQVLPQGLVGLDVELPGVNLTPVLLVGLLVPLKDGLLNSSCELVNVNFAGVRNAGARVER